MLPVSVCREMVEHGRLETQMHLGRCQAQDKRRHKEHVNTILCHLLSPNFPVFAGVHAFPPTFPPLHCFQICGRSLSPSSIKLLFSTSPLNEKLPLTSFIALDFKNCLLLVVCLFPLSSFLFYKPFICSVHIHDGRPDPWVSGPGRQSLLEQAHQDARGRGKETTGFNGGRPEPAGCRPAEAVSRSARGSGLG